MTVTVTSEVLAALLAEARAGGSHEVCGLLYGSENAIAAHCPCANVHPEPHHRFEIDPAALVGAHRAMREGGPRLIGYYHSHPAGPLEPSATDEALAAKDGMLWAIVGERRVTLWRAGDDGLTPLAYRVTGA
ncbi:M67 family metallopeptidase [Qipengyuania sediminis]|uniref:M67 family metallopeptidase n=1 Tax=Qipengyuania sediminis TaxID=1532023 RepID=UPI001059F5B9|nr:M67 family metallopeptidase [Qipengyuania sediminis]